MQLFARVWTHLILLHMTPAVARKAWGWFEDYCYAVYWTVRGLFSRTTPEEFLHPVHAERRSPVLLIPGVYENWRFMQPVAEHLFAAGHPVHVLDKLGYNTGAIADMAAIVTEYLRNLEADDVVVVTHSKGGLIGERALAEEEAWRRVRQLITINTPFSGSRYARLFLLPSVRMFTPRGAVIQGLHRNRAINSRISSLYSVFDPHIPETGRLEGAENIVLSTIGHFRPLGQAETLEIIDGILQRHG